MSVYIGNHFISDELDVDVSGGDVELPDDYTFGFKATGAGIVTFVYHKGYSPNKELRTKTLEAGEEYFCRVKVIKQTGTTATGITALAVTP